MRKKTFWDIYYWIRFQVEDEGWEPSYEEILERYSDYDKEIIEKGISFYNENYKSQ
jgi:hypothetical protein